MTIADTHRDLLDAAVAALATLGPDGRPQVTAVWFLAEGDTVRLSLNEARQKVKNLTRNPVASLLILDVARPSRYLELRGSVEIAPDPDYAFAKLVGNKYGSDMRHFDGPGESRVVVTIKPVRVVASDLRS